MNKKTKTKKTIPTFSISLDQMYLDTKQPKKHQQRFKKYLLDKQQQKGNNNEQSKKHNVN